MGNNPVSYVDPNGGKAFTSYSNGEYERPSCTGGGVGLNSSLSQYMFMSPLEQQQLQYAYGTQTAVTTGMGAPTMEVGVSVGTLPDGTTVIQSNNGEYLWSSNSSAHPVANGMMGKWVEKQHGELVKFESNDGMTSSSGYAYNIINASHFEEDRSGSQFLNYTPPPSDLPGFPEAERVRPKGGRPRWKLPNGDIGEWDGRHGEIERYNPKGKHKGVWDPNGNQIKPPVPGRTIDPWSMPAFSNQDLIRGGVILIGVSFIIFDIVTVPSGEGLIGVRMIMGAIR